MDNVTQILEWDGTDGTRRCFLIIEDKTLPESDIKRKRIEISEYDAEEDEWKTDDTIDYIDEMESFGIPKSLVD